MGGLPVLALSEFNAPALHCGGTTQRKSSDRNGNGTLAMNLYDTAEHLAQILMQRDLRIVLAESCTAGLAAAALARTPGISNHLCGSAVVYRPATKECWLGVSPDDLAQYSAESEPVTRQLALGVLERTEEANFAAAITGHLGPDAPAAVDGVVFCVVACRNAEGIDILLADCCTLSAVERVERQSEAAAWLLDALCRQIQS